MYRLTILIAVVICIGLAGFYVNAQDTNQKTSELVSALDKTKYKKKEKKNVSIEVYADIKNEAVKPGNPADLTGSYASEESDYRLDLSVDRGGAASGNGYDVLLDSDKRVNFTLKDAKVDGSLLTGTKVYENGKSEPFEAVFVNRTTRSGTRPDAITASETKFGLGFIQHNSPSGSENWTNRVFLEKK
jgi:hypothetical protein